MEQPTHACSDQPATPASKNARYTISWRRPSNRSSRLALPLGPSNSYCFSTASHGIRRRSAANASRSRVSLFSLASRFVRAASHSSRDTICGFSIMLVDILISPLSGVLVYGVLHAEFPECDCRKSAGGGGASGNQHCGGYAD